MILIVNSEYSSFDITDTVNFFEVSLWMLSNSELEKAVVVSLAMRLIYQS